MNNIPIMQTVPHPITASVIQIALINSSLLIAFVVGILENILEMNYAEDSNKNIVPVAGETVTVTLKPEHFNTDYPKERILITKMVRTKKYLTSVAFYNDTLSPKGKKLSWRTKVINVRMKIYFK